MADATSKGDMDAPGLSQERIKQLMKSDPQFISRLIGQLDKTMHTMMARKAEKQAQIDADTKAVAELDAKISSHIQPNLQRLKETIKQKTELRDNLKKQLEQQTENLRTMQKEAAALIQNARTQTGKLMRLEEARGFSASVPTSTILRGGVPRTTSSSAVQPTKGL